MLEFIRKEWGTFVFVYLFVGVMLTIGLWGDMAHMTFVDALGVAVLWPLFALKYLAIGIWLVLSAGVGLLV